MYEFFFLRLIIHTLSTRKGYLCKYSNNIISFSVLRVCSWTVMILLARKWSSVLLMLAVDEDIGKIVATNCYFRVSIRRADLARILQRERSISFAKSGLFPWYSFYAGYENRKISRKRAYVERYLYFASDLNKLASWNVQVSSEFAEK